MNKKANHKGLKKALLCGSVNLSETKLRHMIELEVQKSESDMDISLIDNCFELLETAGRAKNAKSGRGRFKKTRKIPAAAAAALILIPAIAAAAFYLSSSQGAEKIAQDNSSTSVLSQASASSYLKEQLAEYGISPAALPGGMTGADCTVTEIEKIAAESAADVSLMVKFEYKGLSGNMSVEKYSEDFEPDFSETAGAASVQNININSLDVYIFEYENACSVKYKAGAVLYNIYIACSIETAAEFAKTIT